MIFISRSNICGIYLGTLTTKMAPDTAIKKDPRAWDGLTPPLAEWILDAITAMGFSKMTPVQASTIPLFIGNKDVVVEVIMPRMCPV
jgi:superfamily II DNA/RNA helicase